jgi:invasion protein IalB
MHPLRSVALAACVLIGVAARTAIAEDAQELKLHFSPWTKLCDAEPGANAKQFCFTGVEARLKSGTLAVAAILIESADEPKKILRVTLPLGMQVVHGTRVFIDQNQPLTAPYVICRTNGCMSDYDADPDMIGKMQKGQFLIVQAINSDGKPISIVIPLAKFVQAYRGPIAKNSTLNDEQKNLKNIVFDHSTTLASDPRIAIYSAWTKVCFNGQDDNSKQICFIGANARIESGMPVVAAVLIEPEGEPKKILRVTLPLGMQLIHGTRVIIDQNQPMTAPYAVCFTNGCMSDYDADSNMISNMQNAQELTVQAINSDGKAISIALPFTNFTQTYRGPPTESSTLKAEERQLLDELQRLHR